MGVTIRKVKWVPSNFRPAPMPSTKCPHVKDWSTGKIITNVLCINHCLPCDFAVDIHLDMKARTGEVHCAAS